MDGLEHRSHVERPITEPLLPEIGMMPPARTANRSSSNKAFLIVDYIFWIMLAVILLRFAFKLIGANAKNAFVTLVYSFTDPAVNLFQDIVGNVTSGSMVVEFASLISVVVLWLVYKAILKLIAIVR